MRSSCLHVGFPRGFLPIGCCGIKLPLCVFVGAGVSSEAAAGSGQRSEEDHTATQT